MPMPMEHNKTGEKLADAFSRFRQEIDKLKQHIKKIKHVTAKTEYSA